MLGEAKCERLEEIAIDGNLEKFFQVGTQLSPREKEELLVFLRRNIYVFAWNAYEASEVDPDFIYHHPLYVIPSYSEGDHQSIIVWLDGSHLILVRKTQCRLDPHFSSL